MEIPFAQACRFMYRPKTNIEQYDDNELNSLLTDIYKREGTNLDPIDRLTAFNTAYAIAVAIENTPHVEAKDINDEVNDFVIEKCRDSFYHVTEDFSFYNIKICVGMAYAILRLQENISDKRRNFLGDLWSKHGITYYNSQISRMINSVKKRFRTDLRPCAPEVSALTESLWKSTISKLSDEEFEEALTFYRTKEEQFAFLDWVQTAIRRDSLKLREVTIDPKRAWLVFTRKRMELRRRIEAGEFLTRPAQPATPASEELPQPNKDADKETLAFHDQCQQTLDLNKAKIKALEAQLLGERKKRESDEATAKANEQTQDFNKQLEDKYSKLQKKASEETANYKKNLKSLQELSEKVLEENKRLKEENGAVPAARQGKSLSKSIKEVVKFCAAYASNIEIVQDAHAETVKDMMEDLIQSPLTEQMLASEKLELNGVLHEIKKNRRQQLSARKEAKEKDAAKTGDTNNYYYAPVGLQVNSAAHLTVDEEKIKPAKRTANGE